MDNMKIMLLLGSIRVGRQSHKIAYYLQRQLNRYEGVDAEVADLMEYQLPAMEERYGIHPNPPAIVKELGEKIKSAGALILISPEYGGSYSGVLKNAVDYFGRQMSGKPIGVVTTSGGKLGGINASHQVQNLILAIMGFPMPKKLLVPMIQDAFDDQWEPVDEDLVKNTALFISEFLAFASSIIAKGRGQFKIPLKEKVLAEH
jgi:NAD(P)H-dependent FMN reductase